jgi:hypothetical protein
MVRFVSSGRGLVTALLSAALLVLPAVAASGAQADVPAYDGGPDRALLVRYHTLESDDGNLALQGHRQLDLSAAKLRGGPRMWMEIRSVRRLSTTRGPMRVGTC